jgi:hypothetical protein
MFTLRKKKRHHKPLRFEDLLLTTQQQRRGAYPSPSAWGTEEPSAVIAKSAGTRSPSTHTAWQASSSGRESWV